MAKRGDSRVSRRVVRFLRFHASPTQAEFAEASGTSQADISRYELGEQVPSEETLRRMAKAAKLEWPAVVHLRRFIGTVLATADRHLSGNSADGARLDRAILEAARLAVAPYQLESAGTDHPSPPPVEARREAEGIVTALESFPAGRRHRLVELSLRASRSWALAEGACKASVTAAADDAAEALAWAELALFIAEQASVDGGFRQRLKGYCLAHLGNALRVANQFDRADEAFDRAWALWEGGTDAEPPLLAEWSFLSLEASLRGAQYQFRQAFKLIDRAIEAAGSNPIALGELLLKKGTVLAHLDNHESSLTVLAEAAPWIKKARVPRLAFAHLFNTADDLLHLGRSTEAAALLPEVWHLAMPQGKLDRIPRLDQLRVRWLEGRVAAGLERKDEAMAILEKVQQDFTGLKLLHEASLVSLELAVL